MKSNTEKSIKELQAEVTELSTKLELSELKQKNYYRVVEFYANPKKKWDNGKLARRMINNVGQKYKPIQSEIARIFKHNPPKWLGPDEQMAGFESYIGDSTPRRDDS